MQNKILLKIAITPFGVLLLHLFATLFNWYEQVWYFDKIMHFLGGIAVAISAYYLLQFFNATKSVTISWWAMKILIITAITALSAISWEFLEFGLDKVSFAMMQPSVQDTMTDLLMGMLGGQLTAWLFVLLPKIKTPINQ